MANQTAHTLLLNAYQMILQAYELMGYKISEDDNVILMELVTDRHLGRTFHVGGAAARGKIEANFLEARTAGR